MRARRVIAATIAAFIVVALPTGRAWACTCATAPAHAYADADAVFVGFASSTESAGSGITRVLFAVSEVYKGDIPASAPVDTGGTDDGCSIDAVPGTEYAIFADGDLAKGLTTACNSSADLRVVRAAGLRRENCTPERPERCVIERFEATAVLSPEPLAVDGPGIAGPVAPRSGPVAAAGVLLLAAAIGTVVAYRARGALPGSRTGGGR